MNNNAVYPCFWHWHRNWSYCCEYENKQQKTGEVKWHSNPNEEIHGTMVMGKESGNQEHMLVRCMGDHINGCGVLQETPVQLDANLVRQEGDGGGKCGIGTNL